MRRVRARTIVAAVAVTAAWLTLPAAPASAAMADCPQGYVCVWDYDGYSGPWKGWSGNDSNWHDDGWGDRAESVYNNGYSHPTAQDVSLYRDVNYVNRWQCVRRGEYFDAIMNDNDYSSHRWGRC
ncbi:peptidase inhibitor family I36 protein [Streptomyces sp. SYSU K217416]